jgi:DNA-binding beta-propeller fold protein YncE
MNDALAALAEPERRVILLRYFRDQEYAQIAAAMGMSEASTRKRLSRAVEKMRTFLRSHGGTNLTAAVVTASLTAAAAERASASLASAIVQSVTTSSAAASAISISKGTMMRIALAKAKVVAVIALVILLAGSLGLEATRRALAQTTDPSPTSQQLAQTVPVTGVEIAASRPAGPSIFVLDDCDPQYQGKEEYKNNVTGVDFDGKQAFRISGFNNCESIGSSRMIATDRARGCIWVLENAGNRVKRLDLAGNVTLAIGGVNGTAIAVDPDTGNLWALVGNVIGTGRTMVFDDKGRVVASYKITGWDIVNDARAKAFWVADKNLTKVAAATGGVLFSLPICAWCASSIDVDPAHDAVWVTVRNHPEVAGSSNELLKFDANGKELAVIELGQKVPYRVSVDAKDGSVWVANCGKSVERFSSEGKSEAEYPIAAFAVQVDPGGDGVWIVTASEVERISAKGAPLRRMSLAAKSSQAWIASLE